MVPDPRAVTHTGPKKWVHRSACTRRKWPPRLCRCGGKQEPGSNWCGNSRAFDVGPLTFCTKRCRDHDKHIEEN